MKQSILLTLFSLICSYSLFAQGNAAEFTKSGFIEVPQASAYLSEDGMTIEAWVFPRNEAPGWPNFDGIMGIRNELNCDFYILHLSPTEVEARFRNSDGQDFTIVNGGLITNQWNHVALTYGGSFLTYYLNGEFQQVIQANGLCGDSELPLTLGKINFNTNDFYFDGMLDEVRFWFEERSEEQIEQFYNCKIENPEEHPTLGFFYNLDETEGAIVVEDSGEAATPGNVIDTVLFLPSTVEYKVVNNTIPENIDLKVYPNPNSGSFFIEHKQLEITQLQIINLLGQKVNMNTSIQQDKMFVSGLEKGYYFVHIHTEQSTIIKRIQVN